MFIYRPALVDQQALHTVAATFDTTEMVEGSPWIPDRVSVDPRQTGVFVWIPAIFGGNCGSPTLA